ncbi:MAG: YciI family protein [Solirubrobacterales bacterium]
MKYLMVLWYDETEFAAVQQEDAMAVIQRYSEVTDSMRDAGAYVAGEGLTDSSSATSLSVRDGQRLVSDGPFAETKEQIAGFYLIEADDLDAALAWAEKIPAAENGSIEIRPVMEYPEG